MKSDRTHHIDVAARLKDLEHFTGALVTRRQPEPEEIPISEAPAACVPVPRRSRVFLRNGGGAGVFAEFTLTAPRPARD